MLTIRMLLWVYLCICALIVSGVVLFYYYGTLFGVPYFIFPLVLVMILAFTVFVISMYPLVRDVVRDVVRNIARLKR